LLCHRNRTEILKNISNNFDQNEFDIAKNLIQKKLTILIE